MGKIHLEFKYCCVYSDDDGDIVAACDFDGCCGQYMSRDEAIAAARAILKHFDAMPGLVGKEEW